MKFRIEKNVPFKSEGNGLYKYPFKDMAVGDSIYVENDAARVCNSAQQWGRVNNKKFVTRKENNGRRIWRMA